MKCVRCLKKDLPNENKISKYMLCDNCFILLELEENIITKLKEYYSNSYKERSIPFMKEIIKDEFKKVLL